MKIAILARVINQNSGARAAIKLAQYLVLNGNQVDLYASDWQLDKELLNTLTAKGIQIRLYHLPQIRVLGNIVGSIDLFFKFRKKRYDLVSSHVQVWLLIPVKLTGSFIVRTFYGSQLNELTINKKAGLNPQFNILASIKAYLWDLVVKMEEKISFIFSDITVAISKYLTQEMKELYSKDINYIYLGADSSFFNKNSQLQPQSHLKLTILSVSRIVPYKGFDLLIKAFLKVCAQVPKSELIIAGSSSDPKYLEQLNKIKNDRVKIIMNPTDKELKDLYQSCAIYATGDLWVPWSLTPLEASFLGKPLVGMNRGAMAEIIIHDQTGLLASNQAELDRYLERLLMDSKLRERLGAQAKARVDQLFTWEKAGQKYLEFFQSLLEKKFEST